MNSNNLVATAVDKIYELRRSFTIIGLTGRLGSGCSEVAKIFNSNFEDVSFSFPENKPIHNNQRKYKICYNYLSKNWLPFEIIKYRDVLTIFLLKESYEQLKENFRLINYNTGLFNHSLPDDFAKKSDELQNDFLNFSKEVNALQWQNLKKEEELRSLFNLFFNPDFKKFSDELHNLLKINSKIDRVRFLQNIANNIRSTGTAYNKATGINISQSTHIYTISKFINHLIKSYRQCNNNSPTKIVIDSLKNSLEIMFFKERYSGFYMFSVNKRDEHRESRLGEIFGTTEFESIQQIDNREYKGTKNEFFSQDVANCIQKSDVHLYNINPEDYENLQNDEKLKYNTFELKDQILQYISLIQQPGIITPSPEERIMQIAYTAKYNSGCISRQVGAVVTDEDYIVKGIGWNNTAEGQVPCLLRSVDDLIKGENKDDFSSYEISGKFLKEIKVIYESSDRNSLNAQGKSCSYCFKEIQNSIDKQKNQVHTRSLHAEENAFLQVTKYGGTGVKDGILFTTASPCELCAKKAYQLGIRTIVFIDPYPGISKDHILNGGRIEKNPKVKLFNGAIGRAYHKLYEPFMAYKDEISLITGLKIEDHQLKLEAENRKLIDEKERLEKEVLELKMKLEIQKSQ